MNAYEVGVRVALEEAGLTKEADFELDDLKPALMSAAGTLMDVSVPAGLGAASGSIYGSLADEGDPGVSALRGLISGAGSGLGLNIAHRLTHEPSFWDPVGTANIPAMLGGSAGGGILGYLLARQLIPENE